ncbi:MAG TPA: adenylosuccinate synthetase [Anaerolineales bacterium]|nr:adenylosuccinate synthetase [Anaerolineales bacterium]
MTHNLGTRASIVVDLGFGDAGKGSIVDYLAHTRDASTIIRYTGGPHAAHHIVRADGVSHAFCQFGATFKPGVHSHLARNVIVKPENLIYEGRALQGKGIPEPFRRLSINPACRVVTSYHAMLCQMKEIARGENRRGTVGVGAGEAVAESERFPDLALRVADLYEPAILRKKLCAHYKRAHCQAQTLLSTCNDALLRSELRTLYDSFRTQVRLKNVLALYRAFATQFPITLCSDEAVIVQNGQQPGGLIFEGAHAALLDHDHGYYPYVAKTDTTVCPALAILDQAAFGGAVQVIGVMRALGYRHGPGPFVTEDPHLAGLFEERHNRANAWQGRVRYGWFDLPAIRHGISLNPRVDVLALTMLDHLAKLDQFRVCLSYEYCGTERHRLDHYFEWATNVAGRAIITAIRPVPTCRRDELSHLLFDCVPNEWRWFGREGNLVTEFIDFLESPAGLNLPVQITSVGPTLADKVELAKFGYLRSENEIASSGRAPSSQ